MKKIHRKGVAGFMLALVFAFNGCGDDNNGGGYTGSYGSLTYQGKTYKTVKISNQTWMAENLNYEVEGGFCYDNDPANCEIYGRLYDWATVMGLDASCNYTNCSGQVNAKHRGICPSGWHIPSDEDWDALITTAGDSPTVGKYLKATSGWNSDGNGLDTYGFSALPSGFGLSDGDFYRVGSYTYWWSSSEYNGSYVCSQYACYDTKFAGWYYGGKYHLFSVRCVMD
jgi:uncharacterized protein (TIGR02145 family)